MAKSVVAMAEAVVEAVVEGAATGAADATDNRSLDRCSNTGS
jgi:hypothetical protein